MVAETEKKDFAETRLPGDIKLDVHDLLRYAYIGIIAMAAFVHCAVWPSLSEEKKPTLAELSGAAVAGGAVLAVPLGAIVYQVSRTIFVPTAGIIAEICYFIYATYVCKWIAKCCCVRRVLSFVCGHAKIPTRYMFLKDEFGYSYMEAELAFFVLRVHRKSADAQEGLWAHGTQQQFYRQHSEHHLLLATGLIILLMAVRKLYLWQDGILLSFFVGIFITGIGGLADIVLSQRECSEIRHVELANTGAVADILKQYGLVDNAEIDKSGKG